MRRNLAVAYGLPDAFARQRNQRPPSPPKAELDPRRVAVIDDSATFQMQLRFMLRKMDHVSVDVFSRPEAWLIEAITDDYDLVVIDQMMPGKTGIEFVRELRANPLLADVPVVMVTACDKAGFAEHSLEAGVSAFLQKPVGPEKLRKVVTGLLWQT